MKDSLLARAVVEMKAQFLKIAAEGVYYSFLFSNNGNDWTPLQEHVDGSFLGLAGAGRFTGTFIVMYASSNSAPSRNHADFDWFEYAGME